MDCSYIFILPKFYHQKKCILIFDKATSHINNDDIIAYLGEKNISYITISRGFTRYLQSLEVAINKSFKMALKKEYLKSQQQHLNYICWK